MRAMVSVLGLAWLLAAGVANAAPVRTKGSRPPVKALTPASAYSSGFTASNKEQLSRPSCAQVRRRLWVEGQGWMVRAVPTCPETFLAR